MKQAICTAAVIALSVLLPGGASAHDPTSTDDQPEAVVLHNCREMLPIVNVSYASADALVPDTYRVTRVDDPSTPGTDELASLLIVTRRCERMTMNGVTAHDTIDAYISVAIDEPGVNGAAGAPPPHRSFLQLGPHDDASGDPGLTRLEAYLVQWVTNNKLQALWLKRSTGLADQQVRFVPDLEYNYNPQPASLPGAVDPAFSFRAPDPAPSPFHVDAQVPEPGHGPWDNGTNLWADTGKGTLIIFGEHHKGADQFFARASGTITADDPGSPLGTMFGGANSVAFPPDELTGQFTTTRFSDGQYTKCLRNAANPCTAENHLSAGLAHAEETNCDGVQAVIKVPPENVDPLVPDDPSNANDFRLLLDGGMARVSVGANQCEEVRVYDEYGNLKSARKSTYAAFRVDLCDPEPTPGESCDIAEPNSLPDVISNEIGHTYVIWIASDNPDLVTLFRRHGGLSDRQAVWVSEGFVFELTEPSGSFHFVAPEPTPSPFEMFADLGPLGPLLPRYVFDQWAAVPTGTMRLSPNEIDQLQLGTVLTGRVVPEAGSEMARVFCGSAGTFSPSPDSFRTYFPAGRYPVEVDTDRTTSGTAQAACPPRP